MNKLKLGIIGTNFVSDWLANAAERSEEIEAHAVLSRTEESGKAFAARHGIENVYTNEAEFLSSGIDAVYIATPNSLHSEYALRAIAAGLHVLCEKPIASNRKEFLMMRDAARSADVVLLEAMRPAYDPAYDDVRAMMKEIGAIRRASLIFCQYSSRYDKYREGEILRAFCPEYSNAAIMDIGVYPIHVCLRLFGFPTGDIMSKSVLLPNGFEGAGELLLPYDGMSVHISYSKTADSHSASVISGEDGEITIDRISAPGTITLNRRNGASDVRTYGGEPEENMIYELREFVKVIRDEKNPHSEYSDMEMKVLDEVRRQNGILFPADRL